MKRVKINVAIKRVRIAPKRGRPDLYKADYARMAVSHCKLGATDADLSELFGVTVTAIKNWMVRYPEFGEAIRHGKSELFDPKVERSLAQLALGYEMDCEEAKVLVNGRVVRYPVRKKMPPNVTACIFWLKNRQPEQWRDVQAHDHKHKLEELSKEDLLAEIKKDIADLGLVSLGVAPRIQSNGKTQH